MNPSERKFQILLIEDDDVDRMAVRRLLKRSGFDANVVETMTGALAVDLAVKGKFDCILLDYLLPDMDGLEFLHRMAEARPIDAPAVIVLTGEGDETIAVNAMKAGAQDYLVKNSMTADILLRTIHSAHEKVSLRREIDQKTVELERSNKAKSEFLATMSHELRTPLNAIIGFAQIMKDELRGPVDNPEYADFVSHIHDSGQHLLDVINDILDLSKIEAGQHKIFLEKVDVSDVVERCSKFMLTRSQNENVSIVNEIPDQLPEIWADKLKMKQVLLNLLSNAVKFTPAGGSVTIKASIDHATGFTLQVIDTGIGLTKEDIPTAMAPFGQIDSSLSRNFDGTGLGLPLSKSFIELHGGTLDLDSMIGVGTTVTICLPADCIVTTESKIRATLA